MRSRASGCALDCVHLVCRSRWGRGCKISLLPMHAAGELVVHGKKWTQRRIQTLADWNLDERTTSEIWTCANHGPRHCGLSEMNRSGLALRRIAQGGEDGRTDAVWRKSPAFRSLVWVSVEGRSSRKTRCLVPPARSPHYGPLLPGSGRAGMLSRSTRLGGHFPAWFHQPPSVA